MQSCQIEDIPVFMTRLLNDIQFDHFLLVSARLTTFVTYEIDGTYLPGFFPADEEKTGDPSQEPPRYAPWRLVRPHLYSLIRGNNRPLEMKLVFQLSPHNQEKLSGQLSSSLSADAVSGLYLNIHYKNNEVICSGGLSHKTFTLDRQADQLWDMTIQKMLRSWKIPFVVR